MAAVADEAHELSNLLGDDHDLAALAAWARANADAPPELFEAIDRRQAALEEEALALGSRLYAEKPRAYRARLERLWDAREATVRAP